MPDVITSIDDIAVVAAMAEPVERNTAITATYRRLAGEVAAVVGSVDVNWLAFGAWASATAGRAIRGQGLPVDWGTSSAVAAGNRAIIADIGPRFAWWIEQVVRAGRPSAQALRRTLQHPLFDGVPSLANAFAGYHEAAAIIEADPLLTDPDNDKRHAELVLRSNIEVAAHEQWLADGFIDAAMPLGGLAALVTTRFVSVITPDGEVDVCRDVPRPSYLGGDLYPPVLSRLADPVLIDLVTSFGQDPGLDNAASDAPSWEDFDERMGYIVCFFRGYLREQRYYDEPPS
jgi:hypothetical protein